MKNATSARMRRWPTAALLIAALVCLIAGPALAKINWHDSYEAALAAAEESGKPIFIFVYLGDQVGERVGPREEIRLDRRQSTSRRQRIDVTRMLEQTLTAPEVMEAAKQFEALKLDLLDRANDEARHALRVSPGVDPSGETRAAMYPITVFLDPSGEELFRRHGSMPAVGYAAQLDQAARLHALRAAVNEDPRDPVKRRELGRAYMEMDPTPEGRIYATAVEHLEAAIRLDPDNAAGAKFDARVDLAILDIPQSPEQSVTRLNELQGEDADGHRALELQYYTAVAHFAMEDYNAARQILRKFETDDRRSPYRDSPWTPQALGLLEYIKQLTR